MKILGDILCSYEKYQPLSPFQSQAFIAPERLVRMGPFLMPSLGILRYATICII